MYESGSQPLKFLYCPALLRTCFPPAIGHHDRQQFPHDLVLVDDVGDGFDRRAQMIESKMTSVEEISPCRGFWLKRQMVE